MWESRSLHPSLTASDVIFVLIVSFSNSEFPVAFAVFWHIRNAFLKVGQVDGGSLGLAVCASLRP